MQIEFADFTAGARNARGVAIVIDVFRACSLIALAIQAGVKRIIPIAGITEALALRCEHPDWLLVAERDARPVVGGDLGNSPAQLLRLPLSGRTLLHTTHAGTQGLTAAVQASHVFTGAFVNAAATVRAVHALRPERVTIVRMGQSAQERCTEDDLCADLLAAGLRHEPYPTVDLRERLRRAPAAAKFFDPPASWAPLEDFDLCVALDSVDFAVWRRTDGVAPAWLERYQ